jgi:hypothetical protein
MRARRSEIRRRRIGPARRATSRRCAQALGVDRASTGARQRRVEPALGVARTADRPSAARPVLAGGAVSRASSSRCGQGASGFTWSGVTGDTPPQSLMPAASSCGSAPGLRLGGAWMLIVRAEHDARDGDGPQQLVEVRLGRAGHARVRLGAEVLDDDFLDVAVALVQSRDRSTLDALARVSPMPIRMPVVNGTRAPRRPPSVASRTAGTLSGEPWCGPPFSQSAADATRA